MVFGIPGGACMAHRVVAPPCGTGAGAGAALLWTAGAEVDASGRPEGPWLCGSEPV